jgi:hypothetical protein
MKKRIIAALAACFLAAGCADILKAPPDSPEAGRVAITIANPARTVSPQLDQFSKIEITFQRTDGSGTLSSLAVTGGAAVIYLPPGTWELTASAYNSGDPPVVVAQARNTLTRTGSVITGETNFVLAPTGTGAGTLEYAVNLPAGLGMDATVSRILIERNGEVLEERSVAGKTNGVFSLERGRYIVDITLDKGDGTTAVYREAIVILPALVTIIDFSPTAGDFLNPDARAALTTALTFNITSNNSSHTRIEEAGGEGAVRTQRLSAPRGTASVYFVLKKTDAQTVTVSGVDAARVDQTAADGESPSNILEVFAVDTSDLVVGDRVFDLILAEPYKENAVIAVTVSIGYIQTLYVEYPPNKRIYIQGENFDPSGMVLAGTYADGSALAEPDLSAYTFTGFDSSSLGEKILQASVRGFPVGIDRTNPASYNFIITVESPGIRYIYFDYGKRRSTVDVQPDRYSVPIGRTLVLAPVKWHIPDNAVYEWKVDGVTQDSTLEYLSFTPGAQKNYAVTVTAKVGETEAYTASTTVECVVPEGTYKRSAPGNRTADRIYHFPAPGQHTGGGGVHSTFICCGAWGGYAVYKFDHSVEKGSGKELKIGGNGFLTWSEPGVVWVMQDENGDGEPNDAWYELAGSHTLLPQTKRRYAVTYTQGAGWIDNVGGMGSDDHYPKNYPPGAPSPMTFVGTGLPGHYSDPYIGYVDAYGDQRYNISDAIQVDGTPVDLSYVDFVKVQTSLNIWAYIFGEISTEIYTPPQDLSGPPDPNLLLTGTDMGNGQYSYQFINNSGYSLTIMLESVLDPYPEFILNAGANITKLSALSQMYLDFYGGNTDFVRETGKVIFADRPE